jgi:hypothetical protein
VVANAAPIELSNLDGGRSFPEVHLIESQVLLLPNHGLIPSTVDTKYHRAQKFCLRNSASVFYTLGVQIPYGCRQGICGAFAMFRAPRLGFHEFLRTLLKNQQECPE